MTTRDADGHAWYSCVTGTLTGKCHCLRCNVVKTSGSPALTPPCTGENDDLIRQIASRSPLPVTSG